MPERRRLWKRVGLHSAVFRNLALQLLGLTLTGCAKCLWSAKVRLTQALIADLFEVTVPTVNEHLRNLFEEEEVPRERTIRNFRIVRREGARTVARDIEHYNLDAILAVGYRVRSERGVQFRRWASERLKEYLVKGFTMDDQRLKNPPVAGSGAPDYFDELLERIRDIRASERRMYLRVREIFALPETMIRPAAGPTSSSRPSRTSCISPRRA
jgi:hypothetical protein